MALYTTNIILRAFFSIALLAVCDAHYCFTLVHIWNYGSNNDSGVLSHSTMGQALEAEQPNLPNPQPLEVGEIILFHFS